MSIWCQFGHSPTPTAFKFTQEGVKISEPTIETHVTRIFYLSQKKLCRAKASKRGLNDGHFVTEERNLFELLRSTFRHMKHPRGNILRADISYPASWDKMSPSVSQFTSGEGQL